MNVIMKVMFWHNEKIIDYVKDEGSIYVSALNSMMSYWSHLMVHALGMHFERHVNMLLQITK
jgi:hypothetical protein